MRKIYLSLIILVLLFVNASCLYAAGNSNIYGEVENGLYTNKNLGAEAYFSENWHILSREEIEKIMGVASSKSSTLKDMNDVNPQTPSFYAAAKDGSANINILVINLGVIGRSVTPERTKEFVDQIIDNAADTMKKIFAEMGAIDYTTKKIDVDFLGSKNYGMYSVSELNGLKMYQKEIILPRGEYAYIITATSMFFDITDDLLAMFHEIK